MMGSILPAVLVYLRFREIFGSCAVFLDFPHLGKFLKLKKFPK